MLVKTLMKTQAPASVILIRIVVGLVFLSEGMQKILFPNELGVGRFTKIGLPQPEVLAPFVALFEISCGTLIVLGLLTRLAVIPTIAIMLVAIATTKVPMLAADGFWKMAHEARTDFAMLLGSIFLLIVGAGRASIDSRLAERVGRHGGTS
jgi:uncharacterized membrane protein YphA (DoxX/SURF4 family)